MPLFHKYLLIVPLCKVISTLCMYGGGGLVAKSCPNFVTSWTVAHQVPLCIGFPRQEYWSGLPFPSPGDLPNPRDQTRAPAWPQILYLLSYEGIPCVCIRCFKPDCQCGSSACIGCQKGLSVLGKQRGTHQKHSQAETTPEGVGRSVVQVCALSHCTASKVENGKRSCL